MISQLQLVFKKLDAVWTYHLTLHARHKPCSKNEHLNTEKEELFRLPSCQNAFSLWAPSRCPSQLPSCGSGQFEAYWRPPARGCPRKVQILGRHDVTSCRSLHVALQLVQHLLPNDVALRDLAYHIIPCDEVDEIPFFDESQAAGLVGQLKTFLDSNALPSFCISPTIPRMAKFSKRTGHIHIHPYVMLERKELTPARLACYSFSIAASIWSEIGEWIAFKMQCGGTANIGVPGGVMLEMAGISAQNYTLGGRIWCYVDLATESFMVC